MQEAFLEVLQNGTAGDPMRAEVKWTYLTEQEIAERLAARGLPVSTTVVHQLLKEHGYVRRKAQKNLAIKRCPQRNEQFENIARLRAEYQAAGNPILSIDTKKKELLGNFYRDGSVYCTEAQQVFDHDFNQFAEGIVIPHGLYDLQRNLGYVHLNTSHDTSELACDSLRHWWNLHGRLAYPQATSILLLCDGGGSNSCHQYLFKQDLQQLVNDLGVEIRVAHYPSYCSKYNPIEHRLFPHLTRACQGVILPTLALFRQMLERTHTQTGLRVFVDILGKIYKTGRKVTKGFKQAMTIVFDDYLPKWNYRAVPAFIQTREVI